MNTEDIFWKRCIAIPESGCLIWEGCADSHGYGQIRFEGKMKLAHRLSWEFTYGAIPNELHVLHHCDTPLCINPRHLFLGTNKDNVADMMKKGKSKLNKRCGKEAITRAKLTEGQVRAISRVGDSTLCQISRKYNVSAATISLIKNKKIWRHLWA